MKLGLSLKGVEVSKPAGPVPEGRYTVVVASGEVKETKNGHALNLGYKVLDGDQKGRVIFDFLNIANPSADAVRISMERLATVAWATGFEGETVEDTDDLVNKEPFEVFVTLEQDGEYTRNRVKSVVCTRSLEKEIKKVDEKKVVNKAPWKK